MCGMFPIENAPSADEIAAVLGPARAPSTDLQPEVLNRGAPSRLSPEEKADLAQSQFSNGSSPSFVATGDARTGPGFPLAGAAAVAALTGAAGLLLVRRRRHSRDEPAISEGAGDRKWRWAVRRADRQPSLIRSTVGRYSGWCALMTLVARADWNAPRAGRRGVCLAVALAVVSACSSTEGAGTPTSAVDFGTAQQPYLEEVLGVVLGEAYYANKLDASSWQAEADELEGQGAGTDERYDFVRRLLVALGDRHSSFYTPSDEGPVRENLFLPPTGEIDDQRVGRLRLPGLIPYGGSVVKRFFVGNWCSVVDGGGGGCQRWGGEGRPVGVAWFGWLGGPSPSSCCGGGRGPRSGRSSARR